MVYNFGCLFCQILPYLSLVIDLCQTFVVFCDRCYCHLYLTTIFWQMLLPKVVGWLMLLAIVADVKATFFICVKPTNVDFGRCYCQFFRLMFLP